jgi:hypothetical protein
MPKLTDTQLVILMAAAKREDGTVLPLPRRIKLEDKAAPTLFKTLIKRKLAAERPARGSEASWRENPEGERMALTITDAGLQAIGVEPGESASSGKSKPHATAKPPRALADPTSGRSRGSKPARRSPAQAHPRGPRTGSKQDRMIGLLRRPEGASVEEMAKATGWQSHSVRGVMSGALKKKLGLAIASEKVEGRGRIYRIADHG